jgi:hypothetical protein
MVVSAETKYSSDSMGFGEANWEKVYETVPMTEAQKQHETLKECGLGDLWAGPQPHPPPPPHPAVHNNGTGWERMVKQHFGVLQHDHRKDAQIDVRAEVAKFADSVHQSDPNDACKYLAIEEYRCLLSNPHDAATKCFKWNEEWKQCAWDQHKFNEGLSFIEGPELRKAYRFAPNYKSA